jgi:maltose/moltooligosaccharide transporter
MLAESGCGEHNKGWTIRMEPFRWRRTLFLGLVSYAASLAGLVFDTFVPVLLQAGHPLWHNTTGLHILPVGFALAPSLAFFIMTWDNLINLFVHPWAGVRSDQTWTRWGRRKPWLLVGVPIAVIGLIAIPCAPTLPGVLLAILVTNFGRALFVPPLVAWLGDLFPAAQRSQANAAFGLVSGVAAIIVLVASGVLFERVGRAAPFVAVALATVLLAGLGVLYVREPLPTTTPAQTSTRVCDTLRRMLATRQQHWRLLLVALFLSAGATSIVDTGSSSFAVFTLGMRLGDAAALRVVGVVAFLLCAVPSALLATHIGRRQTVALGLLTVTLTYGATYAWVATPGAYALVLGVAGIGGALVLVNILPLVFDLGEDAQFGACTGLAAVPVQAAAVLGPSVAGLVVDITGSQRTLFVVAAGALGLAWLLLQRVHVE